MDEEETKVCDNCKRDIPVVNYTIHSVHCARNLRLCPVCKEPVPANLLADHHDTLHKPVPCIQCGESVCGTDLEDHVRDSCGHTVKSCRYCELELPRRDLPAHETYCGTRTEQCADCQEWVMIKYRQIHLQSNHGFIRLDDDPIPQQAKPKAELPKAANIPKLPNSRPAESSNSNVARVNPSPFASNSNGPRVNPSLATSNSYIPRVNPWPAANSNGPGTGIRYFNPEPSTNNAQENINSSLKNINQSNGLRNQSVSHPNGASTSASHPYNASTSASTSNFNNPSTSTKSQVTKASSNVPKDNAKNVSKVPQNRPNSVNIAKNAQKSAQRPKSSIVSSVDQSSSDSSKVYQTRSSSSKVDQTRSGSSNDQNRSGSSQVGQSSSSSVDQNRSSSSVANGAHKMPKRTNDQPQVNLNVANPNKVSKDMAPRNSVKKRPAPPPPCASPQRDAALLSAMNRCYEEQARRDDQNRYNAAHGLPPVLSAAEKLEKLRKMDALHNREQADDESWRNRLRGRVWMDHSLHPAGNVLGSQPTEAHHSADLHAERRRQRPQRSHENGPTRNDLQDLEPMSQQQFLERFSRMQLRDADRTRDRFREIKSSLHALRRGLNEVTAPYVSNPNAPAAHSSNHSNNNRRSPADVDEDGLAISDGEDEVHLPCEFCNLPVPAALLVQHQTGCRPDLARLVVPPPARSPSPLAPPSDPYEDPVIPCEFCTESLPVYLIAQHQEQCRQDNLLLSD